MEPWAVLELIDNVYIGSAAHETYENHVDEVNVNTGAVHFKGI